MNQWMILYKKEWMELIRSYKLIWIPIVFILLGGMQPVTSYFLPDILAHTSNLPEGTVIHIPLPHAAEVMGQTIQQFSTMGVLILALSFMGSLSGERISGTASMILVKPVSYFSFVTAKWAAMFVLTVLSFSAGFCAAWYYSVVLFDEIAWKPAMYSYLFFELWLLFVGTLTLLFSSLYRSAAVAAFSALALAAILSITASLLPDVLEWSPGQLPQFSSMKIIGHIENRTWPALLITAVLIPLLLKFTAWNLRQRTSFDSK